MDDDDCKDEERSADTATHSRTDTKTENREIQRYTNTNRLDRSREIGYTER